MSALQNSQVASLQPVKFILNWGRRYSLWLLNFGLACCGIELIAASMSKHDFIRFGVIPLAHGPRQADLLIIAGTVTDKMVSPLKRVYEQMPEPKYVISFGSCANVGGPYWDSYSVTKGVDQIMPVDVFVPGCPPRPEALLDGIIMLQHKIADEEIAAKWAGQPSRRHTKWPKWPPRSPTTSTCCSPSRTTPPSTTLLKTPEPGGSDRRGHGRGPRRSRATPPRRNGRSPCASHFAPTAHR